MDRLSAVLAKGSLAIYRKCAGQQLHRCQSGPVDPACDRLVKLRDVEWCDAERFVERHGRQSDDLGRPAIGPDGPCGAA